MAKPAARITDPTSCPMPGHGPKAIASGSPDVFFDGLAASTKGDTCTCGSVLASAVAATVFINGKVFEGRDIRFKGSSVHNYNTGVIGIVLLEKLTTANEGGDMVALARQALEAINGDMDQKIPAIQIAPY
jgi:uncharacterized Zn-binding protein involved in type VI secretion